VRTVFLGTSPFAVTVLERLAGSAHRPALVVTRPDRPRGRGRKLAPPPAVVAARALGVPVAQPEKVNDEAAVAEIAAAAPERLIVCAYGALIREPLLSRWGPVLNVHPSLLPRWRGAAPVERAMLAGDAGTGVSIMELVDALDAGPVCLQEPEPIRPEDTFGTLAERLAHRGGDLLVRVLDTAPACRPQPEEGVTYAEKIEAADRELRPAAEEAPALARRIRALTPHVGAWIEWEGERLGVRAARVAAPGDGGLRVECAGGTVLELLEVQPPGRTPMAAADFLRGRR
jgi:methionyl-tRNA formyltransferase